MTLVISAMLPSETAFSQETSNCEVCLRDRGLPTALTGADWRACREYQTLYSREKELHDKTIIDAKMFRSERDRCVGEVEQLQFQVRALKIEIVGERSLREAAVQDLKARWPWWSWLGIGAGLGAGGVVAVVVLMP